MKTIIYSLAILSLLACGKNEATQTNVSLMEVLPEDEVATKAFSPDSPPKMQMPNSEAKPIDKTINLKKIIKSGDMTIEVADIKTAQEKIQNFVKNNKAYIQNERFSNAETQTTLSMEIRIPNQNFDNLINSFSDEIGSISEKYSFKITETSSAVIFSLILVKPLISAKRTVTLAFFPPNLISSIF